MACIVNLTYRCCAHSVQRAPTCNSTALQQDNGHCKAVAADQHSSKSHAGSSKTRGAPEATELKSALAFYSTLRPVCSGGGVAAVSA